MSTTSRIFFTLFLFVAFQEVLAATPQDTPPAKPSEQVIIDGITNFLADRAQANAAYMFQKKIKGSKFLSCYLPLTDKIVKNTDLVQLLKTNSNTLRGTIVSDLETTATLLLLNQLGTFPITEKEKVKTLANVIRNGLEAKILADAAKNHVYLLPVSGVPASGVSSTKDTDPTGQTYALLKQRVADLRLDFARIRTFPQRKTCEDAYVRNAMTKLEGMKEFINELVIELDDAVDHPDTRFQEYDATLSQLANLYLDIKAHNYSSAAVLLATLSAGDPSMKVESIFDNVTGAKNDIKKMEALQSLAIVMFTKRPDVIDNEIKKNKKVILSAIDTFKLTEIDDALINQTTRAAINALESIEDPKSVCRYNQLKSLLTSGPSATNDSNSCTALGNIQSADEIRRLFNSILFKDGNTIATEAKAKLKNIGDDVQSAQLLNETINKVRGLKLQNYTTYEADIGDDDDYQGGAQSLKSQILFFAAIADAKTSQDVTAALQSFMLPPVSFGEIRERAHLSISAYVGLYYTSTDNQRVGGSRSFQGNFGLYAPIGVQKSWPNLTFKGGSLGIMVAPFDFGYPLSLKMNGSNNAVTWSDVINPSVALSFGWKNDPINCGIAWQRVQKNQVNPNSGTRALVFLSFDMPLYLIR